MTRHHVHHLSEVVAKRKRNDARDARRSLFYACREIADQLGDDIAGFALVAWNREGDLRSALDAGEGPIREALVPTLAGDALNRHVILNMAPPVRDD
jgi:hypothetical protein